MIIKDNLGRTYINTDKTGNVRIPKENICTDVEYLEIFFEEYEAHINDDGYYVIADVNRTGSQLCYFTQKPDGERLCKQNLMPIFGVKLSDKCVLGVAEGMKNELNMRVAIQNGVYRISAVFTMEGEEAYEDITLKLFQLAPNCDYSDMAACYRRYQLERGYCKPIVERMQENSYLKYAVEAPEIRIRLGWKPAPSKILEQTPENEPEMKVACTFDRVKDIIDELKRQGVDKAELCLVGWNISGHDGRHPQLFPVEERLGGEEKLRELVKYAKKNGYQIVCHTNSSDAYNIAKNFSTDLVRKERDGSLCTSEYVWSGGRSYNLCSEKALEIAKTELPKVAELGFEGLHYIDVLSVEPLKKCYDANHKVNRKQTEENYRIIGNFTRELFGGFASEGANDFAADYLDYAFYVTLEENKFDFFDEEIPWWELVYHGIVLYNPSTITVNYTVKSERSHIKALEYGARPSFYYYSKFMSGGSLDDWLGREDLVCNTEEQLIESVAKIKQAYDEYIKVKHLQLLYMDKHIKKAEDVYVMVYSDGTEVECNYNDNSLKIITKNNEMQCC
ncbi:MAG: hypothetical protein IKA09_10080 [Lachnospiraceae bacterium]|nr:hypothetical protein [Lachnospiraceae bacterium]